MYSIKPVISTTTLTCGTTLNSLTVTSSAAFGSVVAGQAVAGPGITLGTKVAAVASTSSLTLTAPATATSASASLQFGYFTSAAYTSGDTLGFPFVVPFTKIQNIIVVDFAKQATSMNIVFFKDKLPASGNIVTGPGAGFVTTADNAAFAPSDADAAKIVGYLALTVNPQFSNNYLCLPAATTLPINLGTSGKVYGQLLATGAWTYTAVTDLTVNILGE